jgi:SAM-dependent methyltransferase
MFCSENTVILLRLVGAAMCGDDATQVQMRDHFIKYDKPLIEYEGPNPDDFYIDEILKRCLADSLLLDIGTGTGDTPSKISQKCIPAGVHVVAIDVSSSSAIVSRRNLRDFKNVEILRADGRNLPFKDASFDLAFCRLALHRFGEARRVLRNRGCYISYGYGHTIGWKELEDVQFGDRIIMFCEQEWYKNPVSRLEGLSVGGFREVYEVDFLTKEYYSLDQIQRMLEFDPIIRGFDRDKDKSKLESLQTKYGSDRGIRLTGDPLILFATK